MPIYPKQQAPYYTPDSFILQPTKINQIQIFLQQTGTSTPTIAFPMQNTIGTITINRTGVGNYQIIQGQNLFTLEKTVVNGNMDGSNPIIINGGATFAYLYTYPLGTNTIQVSLFNISGLTPIELSTLGAIALPINIKVYN